MPTMPAIPEPVRDLLARLISSRPMRRGSVSERYVKCNKPGCPCAKDSTARHGPYVSLVRVVGGKTVSRWVPAEKALLLRQQVEAGQEFRRLVEAYWGACEQWADAELDESQAASEEAAKKGGFKAAFAVEFAAEIEALIGPGTVASLDFEAIETAARRQALALAARAVEGRLNADASDHAGPTRLCRCGQEARYAGRREKTFMTVLGAISLSRAYYHCAKCEAGFCPRDRELGIEDESLSPALARMTGLVGSMVSFVEGSALLKDLAGVEVDAKQVERTAESLGAEIAEDEKISAEPSPPSAPTMYLGMDGTGAPMRKEALVGHAGKQPDGSAKTREVKLVTVWTAEGRDEKGTPVRDKGSVSYSAAIESAAQADTDKTPSAFAQRVEREAGRRGFDQAKRQAVLGDGAAWIWNLADERFPDAIQIVDRFHVKQHLSDVSKAIYGATAETAKPWAERRHGELDDGRIDALLQALRRHADKHDEARQCAEYITRNRHRMKYSEFHALGLCTSTGVVESACKLIVGTRLKRAGMRWTLDGANAIIALRCCIKSGRFEDFWERRAERCAA